MSSARSNFRLALIPFALSLAFGGTALAQEAMRPEKPEQKPNQVAKPAAAPTQKVEISGAKGYDERRQDTASKIVVTQEEIQRYGDSNIGDVLKRLPGVTIGGVQGRGGAIRMRGLGAGYTQIMLNGEPSPPGFSLDSISPDNIERIEVFRSATAELSTQAIAGAINIVLKKAIVTAQRELKLGLSEENGKLGGNASLQLSDRAGRMSYSISGNINHGDFERPSSSSEVFTDATGKQVYARQTESKSNGAFSFIGLSPRINWMLENGDMITSQSFINANRFTFRNTDVTSTSQPDERLYLNSASNGSSSSASARTNLNWVHKLADSAKLDVRFGANVNRRSSDNTFIANSSKQNLSRVASSSNTDNGFTFGGKYTAPFVEDHAIAAGWDGGYSTRDDENKQSDSLSGSGAIRPINLNETFNADVKRLALYVQDEWTVSKLWSVYAGIRWEGIDTHSAGSDYAEVNNRSSVLSPILQTLYKLPGSKNDQIRLGLTRTYKAPDTGNLIPRRFISSNNSATSPDRTGNPNLKPELAWGLDAGFEHYLSDGGVLGVNLFLRKIDDFTRTGVSNVNGTWIAMPVNDGQATTRGIEFDAKFPLRAFMEDAPAVDIRANLAFNSSTVNSVPGPNNRLDAQTPVSANFGVDYKLDNVPLTIGGNMNFQAGGPVRVSVNQYSYSIPKRVLDVYALWKFDAMSNVRVSLGNALHQDNISSSSYVDSTGSIVRTSKTPTNLALRINFEHKF